MTGSPSPRLRALVLTLASALAALAPPGPLARAATPTLTPEAEAARLSRQLKGVPDERWSEIAGEKANERYEVSGGDTLYDISGRLFGDSKYWPKVWALNGANITNPHLIRPGRALAFVPGSTTQLPALTLADATPSASAEAGDSSGSENKVAQGGAEEDRASDAGPLIPVRRGRSEEWRNLPRQRWENYSNVRAAAVDAQGFDTRGKIKFGKATRLEIPMLITTEPMDDLGEIYGSRQEAGRLFLDQTVFIRSRGSLQVGETYGVIGEPDRISHSASSRTGLAYEILGKIRIVGVKDNIFIGQITAESAGISRGDRLVPLPPPTPTLAPVPGPQALDGTIFSIPRFSTKYMGQHEMVFVDRGTEDGVKPGMVFRVYQYRDGFTGDQITESNLLRDADVSIVSSSERFSLGIVSAGYYAFEDGAQGTLLTDVSDIDRKRTMREKTLGEGTGREDLERIDRGDQTDGIGRTEERELEQLEKAGAGAAGTGAGTAVPTAPGGETLPEEAGVIPEAPSATDAVPPAPESTDELLEEGSVPPPPAGEAAVEELPEEDGEVPPPPPAADAKAASPEVDAAEDPVPAAPTAEPAPTPSAKAGSSDDEALDTLLN